jgi:hypothetical protein
VRLWSRQGGRFAIAGLTTLSRWIARYLTLNATHAAGFNTDAPVIAVSWADTGSGVFVFVVTAGVLTLLAPNEPAKHVVAAAAVAGCWRWWSTSSSRRELGGQGDGRAPQRITPVWPSEKRPGWGPRRPVVADLAPSGDPEVGHSDRRFPERPGQPGRTGGRRVPERGAGLGWQ